jgi:heptosyltransferase-2
LKIKPEKILIIQTAFLGDVILITPLIRETKKQFPNSDIDVLIIPESVGALENNPNIRYILKFDKRNHKWVSYLKLVRIIRQNHYDLAISPHSSITTAYLMLLGGIKIRVGFDRWHSARYLTQKVPHKRDMHKREKNLQLLRSISNAQFDSNTELFPSKEMIEKYKKILDAFSRPGNKVIAIAPGSIWFTKRWPVNHYTKLVQLLESNGFDMIFIGATAEKGLCDKIISDAGSNGINFAGSTSILESAAIIQQCDLLICNDSGAMHIANAMKTDVVAFFGPTVQSIGYFPYRENDKVFELAMECRPCGKHGSNKCPLEHHNCMRHITPEEVFNHIKVEFS